MCSAGRCPSITRCFQREQLAELEQAAHRRKTGLAVAQHGALVKPRGLADCPFGVPDYPGRRGVFRTRQLSFCAIDRSSFAAALRARAAGGGHRLRCRHRRAGRRPCPTGRRRCWRWISTRGRCDCRRSMPSWPRPVIVSAYHSDVLGSVEGQFDLIIANPPYMNDSQHRAYRDGGGALGEALSLRIVREALPRLEKAGSLVLYTGVAMVAGTDPFLESIQPLLATTVRLDLSRTGPRRVRRGTAQTRL